jgi:hypothetical protein
MSSHELVTFYYYHYHNNLRKILKLYIEPNQLIGFIWGFFIPKMNSTPAPDGLYCPNAHFKIIKVGQKIIKDFF